MENPRNPLDRPAGGVAPELQMPELEVRDKKPRIGPEGAPVSIPEEVDEIDAEADYAAFDRGEWPFDDDPPDPL